MCLSNVYENSVEQKNLILSNVQRIDCKEALLCSTICLSAKRALRAVLRPSIWSATPPSLSRTDMAEYEVVREVQNLCGNNQMRDVFFEEIETDDPVSWVRGFLKGKDVELTVDEKENGDLTVYAVSGGVSQKFLMTKL